MFFVYISSGKITAAKQDSAYKAPDEEGGEDAQADTAVPLAAESFVLFISQNIATQQEQGDEVEEEKKKEQKVKMKEQEVAAWLATCRLGHVWETLHHFGVESLEDLALDVKDEDAGQLALRSTIKVRRF